MAGWDDVDFKAQQAADAKQPAQAVTPGVSGWSGVEYAKIDPSTENPTPGFDLQAQYAHYLEPVIQDFGRHYSNGEQALSDGLNYAKVLKGEANLEDVKSLVQQTDGAPDLTPFGSILAPLAESIPTLREMAVNAAAGAAVGAGVGSVVPGVGTLAGAATLGQSAAITTSAEVAAGNMLKDLTDSGVPLDKARNYAIVGGLVTGALQQYGVGQLGKQVMVAATRSVIKEGFVASTRNIAEQGVMRVVGQGAEAAPQSSMFTKFIQGYLKNAGITLADTSLQNLTNTVTTTIGKLQSGIEVKDLTQRLTNDLVNAFKLAATVPAVVEGVSKAAAIHYKPDLSTAHRAALTLHRLANHEAVPSPEEYERLTFHEVIDRQKAFEQKQVEKYTADKELRNRVLKGVLTKNVKDNSKSLQQLKDETLNQPNASVKGIFKGTKTNYDAYLMDFEGKLNTMLEHVPKAERESIIKELDPSKALHNEKQTTLAMQKMFAVRLSKHTGLSETAVARKVIEWSQEKKLKVRYTDYKGNAQTYEGSYMNGLGTLLDMERPNNKAGMHHNGFTYEVDQGGKSLQFQLKAALDAKDKNIQRVGTAIKEWFHKDNLPLLRNAFYHDTGKRLVEIPDYSGTTNRSTHPPESSYDNFVQGMGGTVFNEQGELAQPTATKELEQNNLRIERRNPVVSALQAAHNTSHYLHLTDMAKRYNIVFNDGNTIKAVSVNHSPTLIRAIRAHAGYITKGAANIQHEWLKAINSWMGKYGHSVLSLDWTRYPRHVSTVGTYAMADIGGGKTLPALGFAKGIAKYYSDPAKWNDMLWKESVALQNKYADNGNALAGAIQATSERDLESHALADFMGVSLVGGAQHADQAGMTAVYSHMRDLKATHEQALEVAERALENTQYSNTANQLSVFALDPNTTAVSKFTQYPTKMFQLGVIAAREAINHPSINSVVNAAKVAGVIRATQFAFEGVKTAYIHATSIDEQEKDAATWHLIGEATVGPLPILFGPIGHDVISGLHLMVNAYERSEDPSIEPAKDYSYGLSLMPFEVTEALGEAAFRGFHIALQMKDNQDIAFGEWLGLASAIERGPNTIARRLLPITNAVKTKVKREENK